MEKVEIFYIDPLRMGIDGKGITTLVLLHGCSLRCRLCANSCSWDENTPTAELTAEELLEEVSPHNLYYLSTGGGITFGGGEPLLHSRFIREFTDLCPKSWNINIETSLHVPLQNISDLISGDPARIRQWIIDIKTMEPQIYQAYTSNTIEPLLQNLTFLIRNISPEKILIRIPLIPNYTDQTSQKKSRSILEGMGFTHFDEFEYIIPKN